VAEQELHHAQIGAVVEKMGGERVAQHVRRQAGRRDAGLYARRLSSAQNACRVSAPRRAVTKSVASLPSATRLGREVAR
jgi:hypothetical protein